MAPAQRPSGPFDVAIIGGGFVGLAVLRELSNRGLSCLLLESNTLLSGVSKGNTGIVCDETDAKPGTLEYDLLKLAYPMNLRFIETVNLPHKKTGAIYVQWQNKDSAAQSSSGSAAPSHGHRKLTKDEVLSMEEKVASDIEYAIVNDKEVTVDPFLFGLGLVQQCHPTNATILQGTRVQRVSRLSEESGSSLYELAVQGGVSYTSRLIVNCCGMRGQQVHSLIKAAGVGADMDIPEIIPIYGEYVVLEKQPPGFFQAAIGQIPTPKSRGIYVFQTVHGHVVVGPTRRTSEELKNTPHVGREMRDHLRKWAVRVCPRLESAKVVGTWMCPRPSTSFGDYVLRKDLANGYISCVGIRSTGMSGCMGVAKWVAAAVRETKVADGLQGFCADGCFGDDVASVAAADARFSGAAASLPPLSAMAAVAEQQGLAEAAGSEEVYANLNWPGSTAGQERTGSTKFLVNHLIARLGLSAAATAAASASKL
eukprot:TRINITY_DN34063_c0_g1_i1.p1 TRINITY_DN34063_c0_g1~~TRINITY_DN34063_c0_g1_i1.p1  ORF type:complete len:481 (-),score=99.41 TRINITY_DN34063_c0_g1_i1:599-2041(-)